MAETPHSLLEKRNRDALEAVRVALQNNPGCVLVETGDIPPLLSACVAVWRRRLLCKGVQRIVDVGLTQYFPDAAPIACIHDWEDLIHSNPHVEEQGLLCIIPESASIDSDDPVGLVKYVFDSAEVILNGTGADDFRDEFTNYWARSVSTDSRWVMLLDSPDKLGVTFPVVIVENRILIASSLERIKRWLRNCLNKPSNLEDKKLGIVVNIEKPLHPREYPNTLADLVALADANDVTASHRIKEHIARGRDSAVALLLQRDGDAVVLAAATFSGLQLNKIRSRNMNRGFRPGRTPPRLLLSRSTSSLTSVDVERNFVIRVDHQHIHTRGGDGSDLSTKSVLLIGCGSLGGYVAHLLTRAGIGHITIIDRETLRWENIGRHVLGASFTGQSKAEALANELNRQMPHLTLTGITKDWREQISEEQDFFSKFDLVLSTAADWRSEAPLNSMARQVTMPLVLLGWMEPFAAAGHCMVIGPNGGCFRCAANSMGQFAHSVSSFDGGTLSKDSAGCAHYQRYGPLALMPVASLVATTAVDCLLDSPNYSQLRTWISSEEHGLHPVI